MVYCQSIKNIHQNKLQKDFFNRGLYFGISLYEKKNKKLQIGVKSSLSLSISQKRSFFPRLDFNTIPQTNTILGTLDCNPPGKNWLLVIYLKN
jgi:hypothetical protein